MQPHVTILNFDDTYRLQPAFQPPACEWIDLTDLRATKGYCSPEALAAIARRLQQRRARGVTLLGGGSYHYVSLLLLSEIREPFTLVLFDRHADFLPPLIPGTVSCGSWCREAATALPHLRHVVLIGVEPEARFHVPRPLSAKVTVYTDGDVRRLPPEAVVAVLSAPAVYVSIDKDVLDPQDAVTDWGNGRLRLAEVAGLVTRMAACRRLVGLDLCGEPPYSPADVLRPAAITAARRNEAANLRLIAAAAAGLGSRHPLAG